MENTTYSASLSSYSQLRNKDECQTEAARLARNYKLQGFHCSESAIRACADALELRLSEDVIRAACGFRGGGGGYHDRCGILEAGCMLISYLYGRLTPHQPVWPYSYLIRVLHQRFQAALSTIYCRDILEYEQAAGADLICMRTYEIGVQVIIDVIWDAEELITHISETEKDV